MVCSRVHGCRRGNLGSAARGRIPSFKVVTALRRRCKRSISALVSDLLRAYIGAAVAVEIDCELLRRIVRVQRGIRCGYRGACRNLGSAVFRGIPSVKYIPRLRCGSCRQRVVFAAHSVRSARNISVAAVGIELHGYGLCRCCALRHPQSPQLASVAEHHIAGSRRTACVLQHGQSEL